MSLRVSVISGVRWTLLSTVIITILQLLQLAILARFLSPSDFGLMALVMVIISFSQLFFDMGISDAIIHKQNISKTQLSTLYWLNVLLGFTIFLIIVVIAPFIANFYNEQELTNLIILLSLSFIIEPFGRQFIVLWQKEMRFSEIAKIEIVSKTVSLITSIYFAYKGYGVYALVYGNLSAVSVKTIHLIYLGLKEYKPSFVFKLVEVKDLLVFGLYRVGAMLFNYFNSHLDIILIGKLLGIEAVGVYTVAKQLVIKPAQIVNPIISKVTFPAMSKIQNDVKILKNIYLKTINYLSSINFPIYMFFIIMAPEIVLIIFGEKWVNAIPIVQVLSIYAAIRSTGNPVGSLVLARGKANLEFWWNLGLLFYIPLGIFLSSQWGLIGVSWGFVIMMLSLVVPNWYFLVNRLCGAKFNEYFIQIFKPLILNTISGLIAYLVLTIFKTDIIFLDILIVSITMLAGVLILNSYFNKNFILNIKSMVVKNV